MQHSIYFFSNMVYNRFIVFIIFIFVKWRWLIDFLHHAVGIVFLGNRDSWASPVVDEADLCSIYITQESPICS